MNNNLHKQNPKYTLTTPWKGGSQTLIEALTHELPKGVVHLKKEVREIKAISTHMELQSVVGVTQQTQIESNSNGHIGEGLKEQDGTAVSSCEARSPNNTSSSSSGGASEREEGERKGEKICEGGNLPLFEVIYRDSQQQRQQRQPQQQQQQQRVLAKHVVIAIPPQLVGERITFTPEGLLSAKVCVCVFVYICLYVKASDNLNNPMCKSP